MILVATGTNGNAFDRLLEAVAALPNRSELVVQHGPSKIRPTGARCFPFVSFDEYTEFVREAQTVVTHAGAGSVLVALMNGKRPLVVPRLARFNEAIDDHQLIFARRLADVGAVRLVEDPASLAEVLSLPESNCNSRRPGLDGSCLVGDLRRYLTRVQAQRRSLRAAGRQ